MDGGGRLSRSVGRTGPQSNPSKKVASAASRFRVRTSASAYRRPFHDENPTIAKLERWMPRGIGVVAMVLLLAGTVALGVVRGGHSEDFLNGLSDTRNAAANAVGFRITSVAITGRK